MIHLLIVDGDMDDAKEIFQDIPTNADMPVEFVASSKEPLPMYNLPVFEDDVITGYCFCFVRFCFMKSVEGFELPLNASDTIACALHKDHCI